MPSLSPCRLCHGKTTAAFTSRILRRYDVLYHHCHFCGLLQTESPYWLKEAYEEAVASADTGLLQRNISIGLRLSSLLFFNFNRKGLFVDVAGGFGLLTRFMRDVGFDFYWEDPYCQNALAKGFEYTPSKTPITAITAFEVFEHLEDPLNWVKNQMERYGTQTLIFSTELYKGDLVPDRSWWYYAFNTGQHISFYQHRTLKVMAQKIGLHLWSAGNFHMFSHLPPTRIRGFDLFASRWGLLTGMYVKKRMKSRTISDHEFLLNQ